MGTNPESLTKKGNVVLIAIRDETLSRSDIYWFFYCTDGQLNLPPEDCREIYLAMFQHTERLTKTELTNNVRRHKGPPLEDICDAATLHFL